MFFKPVLTYFFINIHKQTQAELKFKHRRLMVLVLVNHFLTVTDGCFSFYYKSVWFRTYKCWEESVWHPIRNSVHPGTNPLFCSLKTAHCQRTVGPSQDSTGWWSTVRRFRPGRSLTRPRCRWQPLSHLASSWGRCVGTACAVGKQSSPS